MKELAELTHRAQFAQWLTERDLLGWGAEVGVAEGGYADAMLTNWQGEGLHLVDLWWPCKGTGAGAENISIEQHEERYLKCCHRLAKFGQRVIIHRTWSHLAAVEMRNASLDFLFIDASHLYPWVVLDLHLYWPKLRVGGLFAVHDYAPPFPGVVLAVDEFAARLDVQPALIRLDANPEDVTAAFVKERELCRAVR